MRGRMPLPPIAFSREIHHLERAHEELCTAITVLRSNVELVRVELRREADAESTRVVIQRHLSELDLAFDRLRCLAQQMRAWHHDARDGPEDPP